MQRVIPAVSRLVSNLQVLCLALFLLTAFSAHAQIAGTGTIQGTVTDATGAALANATVTVTDEATQVALPGKTDGSGLYVFPNIPIATYTVKVTAPNFETYTQSHNVLEVGSNISVNVKMTVGAASEKVEVRAEGLALQTEDATFKQTIDSTTITEMPLNGRHMTDLIQGAGGATNAGGGDFSNGSKYSYASVSISVAGGQGNTILYRLDGGDNNDYMGNTNLPFPFPDAVAQFSVETATLGAQDGEHSGGLVNVVTQSGTNKFHGTAFEFIRNNYLDATNFYASCTPIFPATTCNPKDTLHQNEYGGTFGGPIKRDKLFAFAGYQFLNSKQLSSTTTAHVPTAANLIGDFSVTAPPPGATSACISKSSQATQLLDPITGQKLIGNKYNNPAAGINNPGSPNLPAFNAQALNILAQLPTPNSFNDPGGCGVVYYAAPNFVNDKQFITRVDYNVNAKNNLYGRYMLDGYQQPGFYFPTNILVTAGSGSPMERVQTFVMGENYTINSNLVNSAHIAILRRVNNRGYNSSAPNATKFGIQVNTAVPNGLQLATSGGVGGFTIGGGTNSPAHFNDNTFTIDDEVTWVRGKHQMVIGGEYVRNQLNINNGYETNGNFTFTAAYSSYGPSGAKGVATQNPNTGTSPFGDPALDFLEGTMNAFQQSKFQQNALRAPIPSVYFQDTYHATHQLTIVAGLRWSPEYEPVDTKNRGVVFSNSAFLSNTFSSVFSGGPLAFPTLGTTPNGAPAGALFYGDPGVPRAFTKNALWQFDPNFGVAYDLTGNGKTVIRAGAEYIYDEPNFFTGQRNQQNPPFATAISQSSNGYIPLTTPWSVPATPPGGTLPLPLPGTIQGSPFPQSQTAVPGQVHFFPNSQYIVLPTQFKPAATMQWTASIQRVLGRNWQMQVDYIGNKTSHIQLGLPLNPVIYIPGNWSGAGTCVAPGTGGLALPGTGTGACSTTSNYQARSLLVLEGMANATANAAQGNSGLGYSYGGGGSVLIGDEGSGNYHGLITSINHRLSSTFTLLGNWTWSKCLDIADEQGDIATTNVQNPNNPAGDYGPCGFDYRHIENVSLVAKSNFGFSNSIEKAVVNGWEIAPLMRISTGSPFSVTLGSGTANDNSLIDVNNDRANLVPGQPIYQKVAHFYSGQNAPNRQYLNPAAFTPAPLGTFGTTSRNAFRTPPIFNMDAQISRIFPIHETLNMALRLEAFNVLNHPNFGAPTATTSSGTFGQIGGTAGSSARVFQGAVKFNF
jgi:hypothetical protein